MGGTEEQYVKEAFDTNWVAPLGPNVSGLEQDIESYLSNTSFVGALSSGTAAIHLGLVLLGVQSGEMVTIGITKIKGMVLSLEFNSVSVESSFLIVSL